jgi:plasmid stabilization system protein ParE
MARRVKWTETARNDLGHEADYIARDSKHYAAALVQQAKELARSLANWPERGAVVEDLNDPNLREILVGNSYRMIYHVGPTRIHIVGFIHGARDLPALWKREKRALPEE